MAPVDPQAPELRTARARFTHRGVRRPDFAQVPGPGQESVWDYPRPPAVRPDRRRVRIVAGGHVLAESGKALRVLETSLPPSFYLPRADVRMERLRPIDSDSLCEWKGLARFFALNDAEPAGIAVAWSYEDPFPGYEEIRGHLSFYPRSLACSVDGERVRPQEGGFYGGWVTDEVVGPWKGAPGSERW